MTTPAQLVHRGALHFPQHRHGIRFRIADMLRCTPVTRLAANSPLSDLRLSLGIEGDRTGGMAFEARFDTAGGIPDLVQHSRRVSQ